MLDKEEIFDKQYKSESTTNIDKDDKEEDLPAEFNLEAEPYGIGKPRRIVIRAKLIHD
ncbi:MAG: hypothetical protein ACLP29_12895 [Dissulfurispiraceae bacterium]